MSNRLNLIDRYITHRQSSRLDLLLMVIISARVMFNFVNAPIIRYLTNATTNPTRSGPGYATSAFLNQQLGYYLISRCASEKIFNAYVFRGVRVDNFNFVAYGPPLQGNQPGSITHVLSRLKSFYMDLKQQDNTHYYYDIGTGDHTFLIVKYNNNFRLIQSWMLKYQLENVKFNNDIHWEFPRFMVLFMLYSYYSCINQIPSILTLIRNLFICNNIQAKEYLNEFKFLYEMIFSKELHLNNNTFNLYVELGSEDYLCPNKATNTPVQFTIEKHSFDPTQVMGTYQTLYTNVITNRTYLANYPNVYRYFTAKLGIRNYYILANNNSTVTIPNAIKEIVNYNLYPYVRRDQKYDSLLLSYVLTNYNVNTDIDNYLNYIIRTAFNKNARDNLIVQLHNTTPLPTPEQTIQLIYNNSGMAYFGGAKKLEETETKHLANLANLTNLTNLTETHKSDRLVNLAKLINNETPKKIEDLESSWAFNEIIMDNLDNLLKTNKIYQPFTNLDFNENFDFETKNKLNELFQTIKTEVIAHINGYVRIEFDGALAGLNTFQQYMLIINWFLTKPVLSPVMTHFINSSRLEIWEFISHVVFKDTEEIIEGFYDQSLKEQIRIINNFDLVKYIENNKEKILFGMERAMISPPITGTIEKVQLLEKELDQVLTDKFSNKIIADYVMPLISRKKTADKFDFLLAISMKNTDESGKLAVTELLDNEVILFGKTK